MPEVQDIFNEGWEAYSQAYGPQPRQKKIAAHIMSCRTAILGGHLDECPECGYTHVSYNSCRDRHCPKCQTLRKEEWIGKRKQDVLDVRHFHTVFTIPACLNALVLQNARAAYGLLFEASAATVRELSADDKYLGAQVGFMSILHTWGSNMSFHPHIHMVPTGGGIGRDGKWKDTRGRFFLPVKVMSSLFRGKFISGLRALYDRGEMTLKGGNGNDVSRKAFGNLLDQAGKQDWVVYAKEPFNGAEGVFEYLGRYTHRLVISNNRIVSVGDGKVDFMWKDYRDGGTMKRMTLTIVEFIRRFMLHVLPHGFTRIRHYGLYSPRSKLSRLPLVAAAIAIKRHRKQKQKRKPESRQEILQRILGRDPKTCPVCGAPLKQDWRARASPC